MVGRGDVFPSTWHTPNMMSISRELPSDRVLDWVELRNFPKLEWIWRLDVGKYNPPTPKRLQSHCFKLFADQSRTRNIPQIKANWELPKIHVLTNPPTEWLGAGQIYTSHEQR